MRYVVKKYSLAQLVMHASCFLFFLCALIIYAQTSAAHLASGSDVEVNGYIVDFGYSPEDVYAGESVILNFNIVNETTFDAVKYTSLWVRVANEKSVAFASELALIEGNANLVLVLAEEGEYDISLREPFEHTFSIVVHEERDEKREGILCVLGVIILVICAGVLGFFIHKNMSAKKNLVKKNTQRSNKK